VREVLGRESERVLSGAVVLACTLVSAFMLASAPAARAAGADALGSATLSPAPSGFGFSSVSSAYLNTNGSIDTQAGSHPYESTSITTFNANQEGYPVKEVREFVTSLPPGLVFNPNATPQCTRPELDAEACPADSQVGTSTVGLATGGRFPLELTLPLYNMVPPANTPAELASGLFGVTTFINISVRTNSDYGISVRVPNIPQAALVDVGDTLWGLPAEASHDSQREGAGCPHGCASSAPIKPFFTLPTACAGLLSTGLVAYPWEVDSPSSEVAEANLMSEVDGEPFSYTGCEHLRFTPTISITPESDEAETPAGLSVELKEPQEGLEDPEGDSQSDIKTTTVALPEGVAINPGTAAGLGACQISEDGVGTTGPPSCPRSSKVGTDTIVTPLLKTHPEGNVYLLQSNPPNVKLLLAAYAEGVYIKLVGEVALNTTTGQITVTFPDTPQFPLSSVKLSFGGGAQAALVTPPTCGVFASTSDFTPWSTPFVGDVSASDAFPITAGPEDGRCVSELSQLPFTPTMIAGSTTDQAGGYTGFSMLLKREDGQQRIANLQFQTPEGLLGMIGRVTQCGEPQAAQGSCPASSQIGHTVVGAGPGPFPLFVPETGRPPAPIYLTGPYEGAPYGLAIVVPVVAGPFDMGLIVVRAKVEVNPYTSRLTITTNPATLPTILDGIPVDMRDIDAVIDRPEFMFNPTSCAPMPFTGTAYSTEGASAPLSSGFQVGSCRSLKFNPNFQVSTRSRTSRADGASLKVKLVYPTGALGANQASSQANLASVKVELPKQLPARLTTLQKACLAAVFEANPAACPPASVVGHVRVLTPVVNVPLTGPAYFVSHGGEAFPSLVVVLQGAGVKIELVGTTFISRTGITSSTFKDVPDVPIGLFELTLPEGPYSALAASGNLCRSTLEMPTEFLAQNGAVIHRDTRFSVSGCPKRAGAMGRRAKHRG
jgi:hypothetical protein